MRWILFVSLAVVGCGNDPADPDNPGGADADVAQGDAGGTADAADVGPAIADCSHFAGIAEHADYLIQERVSYEPHGRYRGIPWHGQDHENRTFALAFAQDEALAEIAQAEAVRVAMGGGPVGVNVPGQNGENREYWMEGDGTANWRITAIEYPGDWDVPMWSHEKAALHPTNGSARMGFFYHDFGGQGPAINKIGVGGKTTSDCRVVWVLQMGP